MANPKTWQDRATFLYDNNYIELREALYFKPSQDLYVGQGFSSSQSLPLPAWLNFITCLFPVDLWVCTLWLESFRKERPQILPLSLQATTHGHGAIAKRWSAYHATVKSLHYKARKALILDSRDEWSLFSCLKLRGDRYYRAVFLHSDWDYPNIVKNPAILVHTCSIFQPEQQKKNINSGMLKAYFFCLSQQNFKTTSRHRHLKPHQPASTGGGPEFSTWVNCPYCSLKLPWGRDLWWQGVLAKRLLWSIDRSTIPYKAESVKGRLP